MVEKLGEIGISDSNIVSCHIVKISGEVPALCVLENNCINADELNYLARRIDSFDNYELAKFQGAIARAGICTMKDLINLTFNLHNYTVVTDFSNLKNIGCKHYMDKNIGCPSNEIEKLDFETMSRNLLSSGDSKITPYGVVFCNRLPIEEVYDGKMFPDYDYTSDYILKLEVRRKDSPTENPQKTWLYLPASEVEIASALSELGAAFLDDCVFTHYQSIMPCFDSVFSESEDMEMLNTLSNAISKILDSNMGAKYKAALQYEYCTDLDFAIDIAQNLDCYDFYPELSSPADYGRQALLEASKFPSDDAAFKLLDFSRYGEAKMKEDGVQSTDYGLICRNGKEFVYEFCQKPGGSTRTKRR
ncbi:hypothetical protein [Geosporobacter ferrireducens]|nr:hypothetical protein [Geosporobacter ferrireducens]